MSGGGLDPGDVLTLLAVARARTHVAAAAILGINHTTVARRLRALERAAGERLLVGAPGGWELTATGRQMLQVAETIENALAIAPGGGRGAHQGLHGLVRVSSPEAFGITVVAPALASLRAGHPALSVELASVTRPTPTYGPAADLEIGVTRPPSQRQEVHRLGDYHLGLYAESSYLVAHGTPLSLADLDGHCPIYYVESMLQVSELDLIDRLFPRRTSLVGATSVLTQLELARRGAGVALLPVYLADREPSLQRVLPEQARARLTYWMTSRRENLRRPEVVAAATAIQHNASQVLLDSDPGGDPVRG